MSVEQKLADKNVAATTTATNTSSAKINKKNHKNKNNNNSKKFIKKTLKISKIKKPANMITNVNNKSTNNQNNNNNTISSSSSSNYDNNNVVVANDEIIEELFDFSDTELKELENINSTANSELLAENSNKVKEIEVNEEMRMGIVTNDNNDSNNNLEKEEEQQLGLVLLSLPIDKIDKQSEYYPRDNELVTVMTPTTEQFIYAEGNVDKSILDKDEPKIESFNLKKCEEKETNNDSSSTIVQICNSSIVNNHLSSFKADNNDNKLSTSSDVMSIKANESLEPLPLIGIQKTNCSDENDNNNLNNDERHDNDDDEYTEPYDELLVQFLDEANQIAEARLAARRHARAEAREIRMRELERQQKEQESNADRVFDMHSTVTGITPLSHMRLGLGSSPVTGLLNSARGNSMSSRRSSEDSLEEEGRSLRDIRHELKDVEERFRKAMIANAQLDNDRASQTYQIQLLKDKLEDMEVSYSQLHRECKEKTRDCNALKRSLDKLSEELKLVQGQLNERDTLIADQGLVIVAIENEDGTDAKRALVSVENAHLLGSVQGSLDVRLKKFSEEKHQLQSEVQQLQEQLESYKSQGKGRGKVNSSNGPLGSDDDDYEAQREANKIISDYKYKLQKAEQEIASLQSSLARSETQVIRYKSTAEAAEKAEAELKIERRKLQRENREAMEKLEELETSNNHLLKRLDKLKNAKSALLKDL